MPYEVLMIKLPPDIKEALQAASIARHVTMTSIVRTAIIKELTLPAPIPTTRGDAHHTTQAERYAAKLASDKRRYATLKQLLAQHKANKEVPNGQ